MNQEQSNKFNTFAKHHYNRDNVIPNSRKLKVGSYIEVSIDNLDEFVEGVDEGAVLLCGVVKNIVYKHTDFVINIPDYIEVAVDLKKRPDGFYPLREPYTDFLDLEDITHLFIY